MSASDETHPGEARPAIEVALLPQLIEASLVDRVAVVIDVLRATTTITEALANGAAEVIPCLEVEAARSLATSMDPRPLLGGERGGESIAGFDAGNSPLEYPSSVVSGRSLVFTTTNGTRAMLASVTARQVVLAAFTNVGAVVGQIARHAKVTVVCAGTNGAVTLEDTLLAGAICQRLTATHQLANDQAKVTQRLWLSVRRGKLADSLRNSQGGQNLLKLGRHADIDFAAKIDRHSIVPQLRDGVIQ